MRLTIFMPIVMTVLTAAMTELERKPNGTIIPLIKRFSLLQAEETINLSKVYSHVQLVDAKILRGLKNYEKNTGIPHPLAVKGVEYEPLDMKRSGVGVGLTNSEDTWYTTISIGTPPRSFTVQIDTGCSDIFVPGPGCSHCEGHTQWDPKSSETSVDRGLEFDLGFEDGNNVSGQQYLDNVTISGLTANKQTIGVAMTYSPNMEINEFPTDGMLGMAFQSMSRFPASPLFETLVNEQRLQEPIFSIKLTSSGGELYVGGSNTNLYAGDIVYTDVTVVGFWQVNIEYIQGNGKALPGLTDVPVMLDTGANYIIGDIRRVSRLHKTLGGKIIGRGFYSFPCNNFPTISFVFSGTGGRMFQIPAYILNRGPVSYGSPHCFSSIVGRRGRIPWTIGSIFIMNFYTVFDLGNKRVGFADLAT